MNNHRVLFVEIETNDNGHKQLKQLEGLAIKGRVSRKSGGVLSEAQISIANLNRADIEYLTTFTSPYFKPKVKKKINIYAGYEETGWGRIFSGDIIKAIPSDVPDVWLNIDAKALYYENRIPVSYGITNSTSKELAKSIANNLNLNFDWQATTEKRIDIFNFIGSKSELIKEFNRLEDVTMFEDNGILRVVDQITKPPKGKIKLISAKSGMVGIPEPDQYGVKVKCLLDPSLNCGDWFRVESERIPAINGNYQIYTIDYDFANRENQFYCDIYGKVTGVL